MERTAEALKTAAVKLARAYAAGGTAAVAEALFRPGYPRDLALDAMANDALYSILLEHSMKAFECPACGRLLAKDGGWMGEGPARAYAPEGTAVPLFGLTDADRAEDAERTRLAAEARDFARDAGREGEDD